MARLPCKIEQAPRVTEPPNTTVPVRSFTTTFARGCKLMGRLPMRAIRSGTAPTVAAIPMMSTRRLSTARAASFPDLFVDC